MRKLLQSTALALGVSLACGAAIADKIESVDGVVRGVNLSDGYGTISIIQDGTSEKRTFEVTPETEFTVQTQPASFRPLATLPEYDEISDLRKGDEVTLKIRQDANDGRWFVVGSSHNHANVDTKVAENANDTGAVAAAETDAEINVDMELESDTAESDIYFVDASYNTLPRTATALPMVALGGGLALFAGLGLRARRRRS
ncbi:MAG: hypothetical protein KJO35_06080 [Gammaproteobacteria bacterium]|nr:hypothetical protein [Gammaproteobacteria bacterium]